MYDVRTAMKHKKKKSGNTRRLSALFSTTEFKKFTVISCWLVISFIVFTSAVVSSVNNSFES